MINHHEIRARSLQNKLKNIPADALLITNKINLLYLTGLELSAGKLLIHKKGIHLFVDPRYYEMCLKFSPFPVLPLNTPSFESQILSEKFSFIKSMAFESNSTSYSEYQMLLKKFPPVSLIPVEDIVECERMKKDESEIAVLRKAAALGSAGFDFVCSLIQKGISENELATELEIFWKRQGGDGLAFSPIIAFGANSSMPHYRPSSKPQEACRLHSGNPILIDIGVKYQHYHSDMTRVVYFGKPNPQLLEIHTIVQQAQLEALKACRPGVDIGSVDAAARTYISKQGYGDKFTHNLGHGVGLEIHEMPRLRQAEPDCRYQLQAGNVITIEPGIYLEGIGGVRIEDTIVITEDGYENLTNRDTGPVVIDSDRK